MKIFALLALSFALIAPAVAVPVTVVVVGPDKRPLPDARLDVFDSASEKEPAASREVTGTGGRFSFNWNGKFAAPDKAPAAVKMMGDIVLVRAGAPGLATKITYVDKNAAVIELSARRAWGGLVLDQKQKPIAGATVALDGILVPAWNTETTTDANGRWQLDDLPAEGTIEVEVSEPRYLTVNANLNLANTSAPPLFLELSATITGQMVAPDGKPIAGAPVVADSDWLGVVRTDAQGRFVVTGVTPGTRRLVSEDILNRDKIKPVADPGYIVTTVDKIAARAGETTDIGQWKMPRGTLVTLRAVDTATGKPIAGANFSLWTYRGSLPSDSMGRIHLRILPGEDTFGPELGTLFSEGYVNVSVPRPPKISLDKINDLGTIKMQRGARVKGRVRIAGKTFEESRNLPRLALGEINNFSGIFVDPSNSFQTEILAPGKYNLKAIDNGMPSKDWQIVSPQTLQVPADGAGEAVEIIVKSLKPQASAAPPLREMRGQLLNENGRGVGGAVVNVATPVGPLGSEVTAISDIQGNWSAPLGYRPTSIKLKSVKRPGYVLSGVLSSETKADAVIISGLSLKRSGSVFSGRVVGAGGKAAVGAWVAVLEAEDYAPVQANENGEFQLIDVPLENFTLLAAKESDFARVAVNTKATNVELKLTRPAAFDREALVTDALAGDFEWWRISDYWDYIGSERMGELARRGGENGAWSRYRYALELAQREPKSFGARRDELTRDLDAGQQAEIEAMWNWARAQSPDEAEKFEINQWVDAQKAAKRAIDADNVLQLLRVAAVAHRLKRDDAGDLSDYAAAIAAQLKVDGSTAQNWGDPLAKSGYAAAQSFAEGMKPIPEFKLWWTAAGDLAEAGEIEGARTALARMEALATTPDWIELAARESWNNPTYQIEQVRAQIAGALAKTDAAGAQKLAESVEESSRREVVLVIADRATQAGQPNVAEAALRLAMQSTIGNPENYALAASLAQEVSPQLGAEIWAEALERAVPTEKRDAAQGTFWPSVAMWAFYHARLDKGRSRVLIEREWNWRLPAAIKAGQDKEIDENDVASIDALVMAMGIVDPARAGQMRAQAAREVASLKSKANVGLAAALLMSEEQRVRFGLDSRLF